MTTKEVGKKLQISARGVRRLIQCGYLKAVKVKGKFQIDDKYFSQRLAALPCKVGDEVYTNVSMSGWYLRANKRPYSAKVVFIGLNASEAMGGGFFNVVYSKGEYMMHFQFSDIGKMVFLTREEAEKALEAKNG